MSTLICHANLWRNGTILAATTEAAQFSAEYTQDDSPQLFWWSTAIAAEQVIDCDLGAAREYDFIGILGHNLTASATIVVKGADDSAFSSNVVTDTLTHSGNNLWEKLAAARTKRYVRISMTDAVNPSGYLQVGTIVVGKGNALNRGPSVPDRDGSLNETETERSPSENMFTVQERPSLYVKGLPFVGLDDASVVIVKALLAGCGSHVAWALCLDSAAANTNSYWVHLTSQDSLERQHQNYWNWEAEIEEIA